MCCLTMSWGIFAPRWDRPDAEIEIEGERQGDRETVTETERHRSRWHITYTSVSI